LFFFFYIIIILTVTAAAATFDRDVAIPRAPHHSPRLVFNRTGVLKRNLNVQFYNIESTARVRRAPKLKTTIRVD